MHKPSACEKFLWTATLVCFALPARAEAPGQAPEALPAASTAPGSPDATQSSEPPAVASAPTEDASSKADGESTQAPEDPRYQTAKGYFARGVTLFDAGNYDAALVEFQKAYDHLEGHPKRFFVLDNIGQCHEKLFRYDLALGFYKRYLTEGGADAEDRPTVEATMRALEGLLATLRIRSNVHAEVWVDDRKMGEAPGDVLIPGGRHVVELRAPGHESQKREIGVAARETQKLDFTLDEIREYEGLSPIYFWSGVAATGVAAAAGTYFGIKAKNQHDDLEALESSCGSICILEEDRDEVKRTALTADVFYLGAAVLGIGTTLVYFMTDFRGAKLEAPPPKATATTVWTPLFGRNAQGQTLGLRVQAGF